MTDVGLGAPARISVLTPGLRRPARFAVSMAWFAAVGSRLLVLAAGCAGALALPHRLAWEGYDPTGLSVRLGGLGRVLAASSVRFDAIHYLDVAAHGYTDVGNTVFYPLYPLLIRALGVVVGARALAGILISLVAFAVALMLLERLCTLELGRGAARATVLLVALAPLSFFFSAVYTESLFLALSVGSVYAARCERWRWAAGLAALAALTRVTGLALVPLLTLLWYRERGSGAAVRTGLAAVLAAPAALGAYLGWLWLHGLSPLAPFHEETLYGRQSTGPLRGFVLALQAAARGLHALVTGVQPVYVPTVDGAFSIGAESVLLLGVLVLALALCALVWRRLGPPYAAYSVVVLVLCLWSPQAGQPLTSFDRYALTIFPLWMAAGAWLAERPRLRWVVLTASAAALTFFTFQVATWAFVA